MSFARFLSVYYLGRDLENHAEMVELTDNDEGNLLVTGDELIDRIYTAIRLRRPVLITGPRGSGKSYCAEQAIRRAAPLPSGVSEEERKKSPAPIIGGWHFLQGNREIPREYLSEDLLVIGPDKKPSLQRALVLRGRGAGVNHDDWPGIPANKVRNYQEAMREWDDPDWYVLYLDEINRFGDGFLDSLLSLTEEGKVVRRGKEYYVPVVVVATANPPGYDATAKKLSPPLQARIARSFRVSQPPLDVLVSTVVKGMAQRIQSTYQRPAAALPRVVNPTRGHSPINQRNVQISISDDLLHLAAGATLCLWGDPEEKLSGHYFLTRETRDQLRFAISLDTELAKALRSISKHVVFGPDSRAAADWLAAAAGCAYLEWEKAHPASADPTTEQLATVVVSREHFRATGLEVLSHKVRESFNEGTEPDKGILKEKCIRLVVDTVFAEARDSKDSAVQRLFMGTRAIAKAFKGDVTPERLRRVEECLQLAPSRGITPVAHLWKFALATLPPGVLDATAPAADVPRAFAQWVRERLQPFGLVQSGGRLPRDVLAFLESVAAIGHELPASTEAIKQHIAHVASDVKMVA